MVRRLSLLTPDSRTAPTRGGRVWRRGDRGRSRIWRGPLHGSVL